MLRLTQIMLLLALGFTAMGCVSQAAYDDLQKVNRTLEEQIVELKLQLEQTREEVAFLRRNAGSSNSAMLARISAAESRANRLEQELAAAQAALANAENNLRNLPPVNFNTAVLPADLDNALRRLADQNPGLMTYDPQQGMIKLESDLTFALGSITVSPEAQQALRRLAGVLRSPAAQPYEIRVVGHTDNVPVRNPANVRRFGNNWGLSAFRAISVMEVLQKAGLPPQRFLVAGYGEYHPIVPNGARGARQNRRVEIYLVEAKNPQAGATGGAVIEEAAIEEVPASSNFNNDEPVMFK